jgi:hypothetical protein
MHCPHCGTPNHEGAQACAQCHTPFAHASQPQHQPQHQGWGAGHPAPGQQPGGYAASAQPMLSPQAQPPMPSAPPSNVKEFLSFKKMLTPVIIQILFWIGVVAAVLGGLVQMRVSAVTGLVTMLAGPLIVRIYCELLMVVFRMNATLNEIAENTKR